MIETYFMNTLYLYEKLSITAPLFIYFDKNGRIMAGCLSEKLAKISEIYL